MQPPTPSIKQELPPPPHYCACVWGSPPPHMLLACVPLFVSTMDEGNLLGFNGHPAIQLKYMYSTLLLALLFGCVVYASATDASLFVCKHIKHNSYMETSLCSRFQQHDTASYRRWMLIVYECLIPMLENQINLSQRSFLSWAEPKKDGQGHG